MEYTLAPLRYLVLTSCLLSNVFCYAVDSKALEEQAKASITELYHTLNNKPNYSMADRISWFSNQFMGLPYILGALGEGPGARYDQFPQYRVDGFDCDTYVNTVLSLALANSLESFQQCQKNNRYKNGRVSYINRNHFTATDWNKNNQQRGIFKDITLAIVNEQKHPVAIYSNTLINKPGWYSFKTSDTIRLEKGNKDEQEKRLAELKEQGKKLEVTTSKLPYIPLTALFSAEGKPNFYLFSQIPDGAIIEIVRPNWDLEKSIGTNLDISHLGFAIRIKGKLYFREASSQFGKVVDVSLADYLKEALKSPTIKGINVQIVLPEKPVNTCHYDAH